MSASEFSCGDRGLVHRYADGVLNAVEARTLESHLADCQPCQAELEFLLALDTDARAMPSVAEPADFTRVVMARLPIATPPAFRVGPIEVLLALVGVPLGLATLWLVGQLGTVPVDVSLVEFLDPRRALELVVSRGASPLVLGVVQAAFWAVVGFALVMGSRFAGIWQTD